MATLVIPDPTTPSPTEIPAGQAIGRKRGEAVRLIPPAGKDWRGDPETAEEAGFIIIGCTIWPRTSTEDDSRGEIVIDGLNVLMPAGTQVDALYRCEARGRVWDIEGQPAIYGRKGTLVVLKTVGS